MKLLKQLIGGLMIASLVFSCQEKDDKTSKNEEAALQEENISYQGDSAQLSGYIVYDNKVEGPRPVVLVVPEWWGFTDYPKKRARDLAELGYLAFAIDMYGDGITTTNPDSAGKLATPFYQDPQKAKLRIQAALERIKSHPLADTTKLAAIGYCFGGGVLLNTARLGSELDAVVSFHGSLVGTPAKKELLQTKILVSHGAADSLVPPSEVATFKKQMDSIGADYIFREYPDATHAFTNPAATELGRKNNMPIMYNATADSMSWKDMKEFLNRVLK